MEYREIFTDKNGTEVEIKMKSECQSSGETRQALRFMAKSSRKFYLLVAEKFNSKPGEPYRWGTNGQSVSETSSSKKVSEIAENIGKDMFLYAMEKDEETGFVKILPMNSDTITIHGEKEALFFIQRLIECFQ